MDLPAPETGANWELVSDSAIEPWRNSQDYFAGQIILYAVDADDPATRALAVFTRSLKTLHLLLLGSLRII